MTIEQLVRELQGDMSQEELAQRLGVTQAMVSALLLGKRGLGRKVAIGMMQAFPERQDDILSLFLSQSNNNRSSATTEYTEPEREAEEGA